MKCSCKKTEDSAELCVACSLQICADEFVLCPLDIIHFCISPFLQGKGLGDFAGKFVRQVSCRPTGLGASETTDLLFVADCDHFVRVLSRSDAKELLRIGSPGLRAGEFNTPRGQIATTSSHIWVSDLYNRRVQCFTHDGKHVHSFGDAIGREFGPCGVAATDSEVFVSDFYGNRVLVFSHDGALLGSRDQKSVHRQVSTISLQHSSFSGPTSVAIDASADLLCVAEYMKPRVRLFSLAGDTLLREIGNNEAYYGYLSLLCLAPDILVSDSYANCVKRFDASTGEFVSSFGGLEVSVLLGAQSLCYCAEEVFVADLGNLRLACFS